MTTYRQTRLFTLTWDNSSIPNLEYELRFHPRQCEGVCFGSDNPLPGLVALGNGVVYTSMDEMERNLNAYGKCRVDYHDEDEEPEPEPETEQQAVVPRYRVPRKRA